jgi:dihydroneopterin aldolase
MDIVFIQGLRIDAVIGVHAWERRAPQPLLFDLELEFDNRRAAAGDALAETFDYAAISARLQEFVRESRCQLIETLAERCAELLHDEFGVQRVRLRLSKPCAVSDATGVGVQIERDYPART